MISKIVERYLKLYNEKTPLVDADDDEMNLEDDVNLGEEAT